MRLQISFTPELFRFGMDELEDDTVALMRKRVYDMAGVLGKVEVRTRLRNAHATSSGSRMAGALTQLISHPSVDDKRQCKAM